MRKTSFSILVLILLLLSGCQTAAPRKELIEGAWRARVYALQSGESHPVDGTIVFSGDRWLVLFYVLDEAGEATSGAAEGGTYRTAGDQLTFSHLYNLSSGEATGEAPDSPLRMVLRPEGQGEPEACTYKIQGNSLTINFPSGNRMDFTKQN